MADIYESIKAAAAADFAARFEADGKRRNPAHVLTEALNTAATRLESHHALLGLIAERPDILDWTSPVYARPRSVATYVAAAVKDRIREDLVSEIILDALLAFHEVPGTYLAAMRTAVENSAVIAGALPHEVPEFFEIDFGWYEDLGEKGVTRDALDALTDLNSAMRPLIAGSAFEPRVVTLCGPAADGMTARMLELLGAAADYYGEALAARIEVELAAARLSAAPQMV